MARRRAIKVGKGRSEITITGDLAGQLEDKLREALGPVADHIEYKADSILARDILPNWPVKSGKSRAAWDVALRVIPGRLSFEAILTNKYRYVRFIRSDKRGKSGGNRLIHPMTVLVRKPANEARKQLKKELPALIGSMLDKR